MFIDKEKFTATMYQVSSGNLSKIGYQYNPVEKCGVVQVEFHNGGVYQYWPISKIVYQEIFTAESKGKYFTAKIKQAPGVRYKNMAETGYQERLL